jgi:hypothetical protein
MPAENTYQRAGNQLRELISVCSLAEGSTMAGYCTDSYRGITATGTEFKVTAPDRDMDYQGEMINEL